MRDFRPLSERFELPYVRRKHFADRWTGRLGLLAAVIVAGTTAALAFKGARDDRAYTAGPLTAAHDMFAQDCQKCHESSEKSGWRGYFQPASDRLCLDCHNSQATIHADNQIAIFAGGAMPGHPDIRLSSNCAACHIEHRGRYANLSEVPDSFCVRCHEDLAHKGIGPAAPKPGAGAEAASKLGDAKAAEPPKPEPAVTPAPAPAKEGGPQ